MAICCLETKNGKANETVAVVADRLRNPNLLKNPFTARTKEARPGLWLMDITPVYPNVGRLFVLPFLIFIFWPGTWYGYAGLLFALLMLFITLWWFGPFYYLLFLLKTRGGVSYVPVEDALRKVVKWDKGR